MANIRVFVSHSSRDQQIVRGVVDFLTSSMAIADREIRCTTLPDTALPVGAHSSTRLRQDLNTAEIVICLLTRDSVASDWVLLELGAAWGMGKTIVPLVFNMSFSDLPGLLREYHAFQIDGVEQMHLAIEQIAEHIKCSLHGTPKRIAAATAFLNLIQAVQLPASAPEQSSTEDAGEGESTEEDRRSYTLLLALDVAELKWLINTVLGETAPRSRDARVERLFQYLQSNDLVDLLEFLGKERLKLLCRTFNLRVGGTVRELASRLSSEELIVE